MADGGFSGGEALQKYLEDIAENVASGKGLRVGFLEGMTHPSGQTYAMIAAVNEFGGTIDIPERTQDLHFKYNERTGEVGHRFVKAHKSNFVQSVTIPAHKITVPSRPFFRNTIAAHGSEWGDDFGKFLAENGYDAKHALELMGQKIVMQIQDSIRGMADPANAKSTVKKKGFNAPLRDSGDLLNHGIHYEVSE